MTIRTLSIMALLITSAVPAIAQETELPIVVASVEKPHNTRKPVIVRPAPITETPTIEAVRLPEPVLTLEPVDTKDIADRILEPKKDEG